MGGRGEKGNLEGVFISLVSNAADVEDNSILAVHDVLKPHVLLLSRYKRDPNDRSAGEKCKKDGGFARLTRLVSGRFGLRIGANAIRRQGDGKEGVSWLKAALAHAHSH